MTVLRQLDVGMGRAYGCGKLSERGPLVVVWACRIQCGGHTIAGRLGAGIGC